MRTDLLPTNSATELDEAVRRAVALLEAGEPVALPTETVYGLAADAMSPSAAAKIFEAKARPSFDPLIVHLPNRDWLDRIARVEWELVGDLIEHFWPGPLTLVLPRREIVPDIITSGLETVAVRMSAHPVFKAVIERFGRPLAAPSANRFGRVSPTTAQHVRDGLGGRIPLVVDGGPCAVGIESTIVEVDGDSITILRPGPITADMLAPFGEVMVAVAGETPDAPGQLQSHYAPRTPLRFVGEAVQGAAGLLAWRAARAGFAAVEVLSETGDLTEAAATLFAKMRRLDDLGLDVIVADPVPEHGLGVAIMDRLRKAAAHV